MPLAGPTTPVAPPPLVAPPTGLLATVTVVEHPQLQTEGNLARLVGPDAPDTILASAILDAADHMFGPIDDGAIDEFTRAHGMRQFVTSLDVVDKARVQRIEDLDAEVMELLRAGVARALTAAAGMELGGEAPAGFLRWESGIQWSPENVLPLELVDPCNDAGLAMLTFGNRRVVTDAVTATDTSLVSLTAFFTSLDVGRTVTGAGIPASTTILSVTNLHQVVLSQATTATATGVTVLIGAGAVTGSSRKAVETGQMFSIVLHDSCSTIGWRANDYVGRARRALASRETIGVEQEFMHGRLMGGSRLAASGDGHLTNGSANVTAADGDFTQSDVGRLITSNIAGVPAGTTILTVTDAHTIVLSAAFTGTTSTVANLTVSGIAGGTNRYLSDDHCHVYNTGSVDPTPVQALAYANEVIAKSGIGQGVIHVTPFFLEIAAAAGSPFKTDSRGRFTTLNGNLVVPGNGYDGIGPDGTGGTADDGANDSGHTHEWIYVTDAPVVWRPPTPAVYPSTLREATKMDTNEVTFRAERGYIIEWSALLQTAIKTKLF